MPISYGILCGWLVSCCDIARCMQTPIMYQDNKYILLPGLVGNMARYCTSVYKYFPEP